MAPTGEKKTVTWVLFEGSLVGSVTKALDGPLREKSYLYKGLSLLDWTTQVVGLLKGGDYLSSSRTPTRAFKYGSK